MIYLSFGAGVQSSALLAMSALGVRHVPRADVAVFADTQAEPKYVYDHLDAMTEWAGRHGIEVIRATKGDLGSEIESKATGKADGRFASVPFWVRGEDGRPSPTRRQCTREYKIEVVNRTVRGRLGYAKGERVKGDTATALIGISWDERQRCSRSRLKWVTNRYPLVEQMVTVEGCRNFLREAGLPVPQKSACRFCPYHNDAYWAWLKANHPDEWAEACRFDEAIRDQSATGMQSLQYTHRSLTPLATVPLDAAHDQKPMPQVGLFDDFGGECEGMCGV